MANLFSGLFTRLQDVAYGQSGSARHGGWKCVAKVAHKIYSRSSQKYGPPPPERGTINVSATLGWRGGERGVPSNERYHLLSDDPCGGTVNSHDVLRNILVLDHVRPLSAVLVLEQKNRQQAGRAALSCLVLGVSSLMVTKLVSVERRCPRTSLPADLLTALLYNLSIGLICLIIIRILLVLERRLWLQKNVNSLRSSWSS